MSTNDSSETAAKESMRSSELHKICAINLQHTSVYHPLCNGKVEHFHKTLKTALKARNNISWTDTLPTVLLGLRTVIQEDTNHSIAQVVYGQSLRLPRVFFSEPNLVKKPLEPPYDRPFPVIDRTDEYFTISIKGKHINVSLDRLKPAYILAKEISQLTKPDNSKLQRPDSNSDVNQKHSCTGRTIHLPVRFKD
ncbi:uncharacterized protein LOC118205555 [Stegodyphus dumicola]|uniref:uncharacterized protein LOC118205555 n=1 Tax=Stegodyphus dumicola TaxID=202533 RepID=UPI0015B2A339|nr:uncharacterized protein LOC118205555 [Stegodyphus dumicola]